MRYLDALIRHDNGAEGDEGRHQHHAGAERLAAAESAQYERERHGEGGWAQDEHGGQGRRGYALRYRQRAVPACSGGASDGAKRARVGKAVE